MEIRGGKRFRTKAERRQIVEETLRPGASMSQAARAHDVNSNQVFYSRRQYRAGWFEEVAKRATALVPVKVVRSAGESLQARELTRAPGWLSAQILVDDPECCCCLG